MQKSFKKSLNNWFEFHGKAMAIAPPKGASISVFGLIDPDLTPARLNAGDKTPADFSGQGSYIAKDLSELTGIADLPDGIYLYLESSGSGNCTLLITE